MLFLFRKIRVIRSSKKGKFVILWDNSKSQIYNALFFSNCAGV